jgi:glucose/arabinose dehydrogenase
VKAFGVEHDLGNSLRRTGLQTGQRTACAERRADQCGLPVGGAVGKDGALFLMDDESGIVWRISYQGK